MKKFLIKAAAFACIIGLFILPFNVITDPYNVFHYKNPVNNGVEPNKNFIKTSYILDNPKEFDSFVFGSSRAGFLDVTRLGDGHYYNMCSSESVPSENLKTLQIFARHGITPRHVVLLVDEITCFVDESVHEDILYRLPYPQGGWMDLLKFYLRYLDVYVTAEAIPVIREHSKTGLPDEEYGSRYRATGTERLDIAPSFDGTDGKGGEAKPYWQDHYQLRAKEAVADLVKLQDYCRQNNIRLTIMVSPTYRSTYLKSVEHGYLEFLDLLADEVAFYSFAGLNDITRSPGSYYETSHFIPAVGNQMLDAIQGVSPAPALAEQGFGVYVTRENKDQWLRLLKAQLGP